MFEMITQIILYLIVFKALVIGSDYEPIKHIRYGKNYMRFYDNRPSFDKNKTY